MASAEEEAERSRGSPAAGEGDEGSIRGLSGVWAGGWSGWSGGLGEGGSEAAGAFGRHGSWAVSQYFTPPAASLSSWCNLGRVFPNTDRRTRLVFGCWVPSWLGC